MHSLDVRVQQSLVASKIFFQVSPEHLAKPRAGLHSLRYAWPRCHQHLPCLLFRHHTHKVYGSGDAYKLAPPGTSCRRSCVRTEILTSTHEMSTTSTEQAGHRHGPSPYHMLSPCTSIFAPNRKRLFILNEHHRVELTLSCWLISHRSFWCTACASSVQRGFAILYRGKGRP